MVAFILLGLLYQSCQTESSNDAKAEVHSKLIEVSDKMGNKAVVKISSINEALLEVVNSEKLILETTKKTFEELNKGITAFNEKSASERIVQNKTNNQNHIAIDIVSVDLKPDVKGYSVRIIEDELKQRFLYYYSYGSPVGSNAFYYELLRNSDLRGYHELILQGSKDGLLFTTINMWNARFPGQNYSYCGKRINREFRFGLNHIGSGIIGFRHYWFVSVCRS